MKPTIKNIGVGKLPILAKAFVLFLVVAGLQGRLTTEVCAQESWDFEYGYRHVDQDSAEDYLFETSGIKIYTEWHDPPVTYWGPSANDVGGTITYKFEFEKPTEAIHVKANINSFNFPQPGYFGVGKGDTSLWASVDNTEWVELLYNPLPSKVDSYMTYDELLPESLVGEKVIYIQALLEVWESALGGYTTAQFSRSSSAADQDIFNIKVMLIGDEIPEHHPADTNPDWSLSINEVTGYGAAWVLGNDWANGHTPEIGYATRAGFLWLNGEEYFYDSAETAPMCWVPVGADGGGARPIGFSIERSGCQPVKWLSSFADRRVKIEVKPSVGTSSYAVEEVIEQGWEVSGINEDGFYDLKNRKVKWGPWLGGPAKKARTLQYDLKSPEGFSGVITLSGVASFDGLKAQIRGENQIEVVGDGPPVRIILRNFNTTIYPFTFTFSTIEGVIYEVQVTQDLKKWSKIEEIKGKSAEYKFSDLRQPIVPFERNYYRVKVLE